MNHFNYFTFQNLKYYLILIVIISIYYKICYDIISVC